MLARFSSMGRKLGRLVEGLLDLHQLKLLCIALFGFGKATTANLDHGSQYKMSVFVV